MILLDSCAIFELLFAAADAEKIATFLEKAQIQNNDVVIAPLVRLECSSAAAVRFKEGRFPAHKSFDEVLAAIDAFRSPTLIDDLSPVVIKSAARIKSNHAASMVDCYLMAMAIERGSGILTADSEILSFEPSLAKSRKIGERFHLISWPSPR